MAERGGALVTGASTGIGEATARALARCGFLAFGTVRRPEDAARLEAEGVVPVTMDVTDAASVARAREEVEARLAGRPFVALVNNAGIGAVGPLELLPLEEFRRVLEVNLLGAVAVTQRFLPLLRAARGRIVNVSSVNGIVAPPFLAPYVASKFGLEGLSDSLRRELLGAGVDVIVLQPGTVRTPIWEKAERADYERFRGTVYERALERFSRFALAGLRHALEPDDIARAILRALLARRPPARILITPGGRLRTRILAALPDRWLDRMIAKRMGG